MRRIEGKTFLTTGEAARILGMSSRTLLRWTEKDELTGPLAKLRWFKDPANERNRFFEEESVRQARTAMDAEGFQAVQKDMTDTDTDKPALMLKQLLGQLPISAMEQQLAGSLEQEIVHDVMILRPDSGITEMDAVMARLTDHVTGGSAKIIVNLANVQIMTSTALGILIKAAYICASMGGALKVCSVPPRIQNVFTMTKLNLVLDVYDSEKEALEAFGVRGDP